MMLFKPNINKFEAKKNIKGLIKALGFKRESESLKHAQIRLSAVLALGRVGGQRAVEPLIPLLDDKYYRVRQAVAELLGNSGNERCVDPLIQRLSDDVEPVRRESAKALGKLGDCRAVDPLLNILHDNNSEVRREAARALYMHKDRRAAEAFIKLLGDSENEIRHIASRALGELGDQRAVEPLLKALADDDFNVRNAAAKSLANLEEPQWTSLVSAAFDENIKRLGRSKDKRAVRPLIEALSSPDQKFRYQAILALGELGDREAVAPLGKALWENRHGFQGFNQAIVESLAAISDFSAVPFLIEALGYAGDEVRKAIEEALAKMEDSRTSASLIATLGNKGPVIRRAAVKILARRGGDGVIEALIKALDDSDNDVRGSAAEALLLNYEPMAIKPPIRRRALEVLASTIEAQVTLLAQTKQRLHESIQEIYMGMESHREELEARIRHLSDSITQAQKLLKESNTE